jgi:hypothetical protein
MYTGMPARDAGAAVSPCSELCASARDALARGDLELAYDCYWQASEHDAGSLGAEAGKKKKMCYRIYYRILQNMRLKNVRCSSVHLFGLETGLDRRSRGLVRFSEGNVRCSSVHISCRTEGECCAGVSAEIDEVLQARHASD